MAKLSPLASVSETRAVLEAHGLTTKYSLGQNFLINDAILQKIVTLADVRETDAVLLAQVCRMLKSLKRPLPLARRGRKRGYDNDL